MPHLFRRIVSAALHQARNEHRPGEAVERCGAKRHEKRGRSRVPCLVRVEELLLLLAALLFLATLFLGCHVAILPFHSSWNAV